LQHKWFFLLIAKDKTTAALEDRLAEG